MYEHGKGEIHVRIYKEILCIDVNVKNGTIHTRKNFKIIYESLTEESFDR